MTDELNEIVSRIGKQLAQIDGLAKQHLALVQAPDINTRLLAGLPAAVETSSLYQAHTLQQKLLASLKGIDWVSQAAQMGLNSQVQHSQLLNLAGSLKDVMAGYPLDGVMTMRLADQFKNIGLADDYLVGLKNFLPAEQLSKAIAQSLVFDVDALGAVSPKHSLMLRVEGGDLATRVAEFATWSERLGSFYETLDPSRGLGNLLNVSDITRSLVSYRTDALSKAFGRYEADVAAWPFWLKTAPDFVRTSPAQSVLAQERFVQTVTIDAHNEDEDNESKSVWETVEIETVAFIEEVLPRVNPALMKAWVGAWESAKRRGPDWARQSAASLRYVLIELLNETAPIEKINKDKLPKHGVGRNGEILRPGQVHWLCEPLKNKAYKKFVQADLESAITIVDAMNEAVHRTEYDEIEQAFPMMQLRASISLKHLLQLWTMRN